MLEELGLVVLRGVFFLSLAMPTSDLSAGGMCWRSWGELCRAQSALCDCEHTRWDHKGEMELAAPCLAWPETPSRLLGWICWGLLGRKGAVLGPENWPRVPAPPGNNGGRGRVT